ncbi:MAG: MarR family winged helix-turn-helix transcriptional regulator [Marmoricola sp.]
MAETATNPTGENVLALEQQVCFALVVAARTVVGVYKPVLAPLGLTHPQYLVMLALWGEQPLTVRRLADLLQLDPATLSPLLKRLEALGYVERRRDPQDERSLAVSLTAEGQALRDQALNVPPAIVERLGIDLAELKSLQAQLTRVIGAATAALAETEER